MELHKERDCLCRQSSFSWTLTSPFQSDFQAPRWQKSEKSIHVFIFFILDFVRTCIRPILLGVISVLNLMQSWFWGSSFFSATNWKEKILIKRNWIYTKVSQKWWQDDDDDDEKPGVLFPPQQQCGGIWKYGMVVAEARRKSEHISFQVHTHLHFHIFIFLPNSKHIFILSYFFPISYIFAFSSSPKSWQNLYTMMHDCLSVKN